MNSKLLQSRFQAFVVLGHRLKGFVADIVLNLTRVGPGCLGGDADGCEEVCEHLVAAVNAVRYLHPAVGQGDESGVVHGDKAVFTETLGRVTDTGLGYAEMLGDVNGADVAVLFLPS